jgi:hypothetical protein
MGNESRRSNDGKTNGPTTEGTKSMGNSLDFRPTITASERALNGAILAAEISESYEEHLEIFDHFYADDILATTDGLPFSASRVRGDWRRFGLDSVEPAHRRSTR